MREVSAASISDVVRGLFIEANVSIDGDILRCLGECEQAEKSDLGRSILRQIIENDRIAAAERVPICQDTGMAVLFVDIGQDVHVVGGVFEDAIDDGVRRAYVDGYLRKSVVSDPLFERKNTGDNAPAVLHVRVVPGDRIRIRAVPKGFGSENMSATRMLKPADGVPGVKSFVVNAVREAGSNPCPPVIVGVGVGGTLEKAAQIAKMATIRRMGERNPDPRYAALEEELLAALNGTGIGPAGLGGSTTALAVNIEWYPTHIAGMPVAVNILCHAARHAEAII